MRFLQLISIAVFIAFACNTPNDKGTSMADSTSVSVKKDSFSKMNISDSMEEIKGELSEKPIAIHDSSIKAEKKSELNKSKIEIRTFQNSDNSGYGYDILIDGRMYVHQPNIPALPGNNGFDSEEKAHRVAELVAGKIRNNIMPPTIDVKELDSIGIK